ncbi:helix-turn-helix transcriptional regulator [Kocuria palustris]|uniref:helix-turn-helix transcriptional regulator n=1 Tax=Kocuria palustris TaxID=71999 RepID=UPI0006AA50B8|nr:helix-turn-helix domain-containing protein [Kocuria palustris]ALB03003.1 hypothetical protein KPaMU14_04905 [Kocuria palustris]
MAPPITHLTIKDLAARLGVSEQTIRHWRMRGYGPRSFTPRGSRLVRYRLEDVIAWENEQLEEAE